MVFIKQNIDERDNGISKTLMKEIKDVLKELESILSQFLYKCK